METYLLMLYVTLEQETAIRNLYLQCGWNFDKTDLTTKQRPECTDVTGRRLSNQTNLGLEDDLYEGQNDGVWQPSNQVCLSDNLGSQQNAWPINRGEESVESGSVKGQLYYQSSGDTLIGIQQNGTSVSSEVCHDDVCKNTVNQYGPDDSDGEEDADEEYRSNRDLTDNPTVLNSLRVSRLSTVQNGAPNEVRKGSHAVEVDHSCISQEDVSRVTSDDTTKTNVKSRQLKQQISGLSNPSKRKKRPGKKKPMFCNDCQTMFTSEKRFLGHKEKNGGQCVFKCEYCGKVFLYRKSKYDLHVKSAHTKERPFVCDVCKKGYVTAEKLKIHKRSHTGEKTCICEHCGKGFCSRGELAVHINYHHISKEKKDEFHCVDCNVTFCSKRYLNYHKTVTHSTQRDFFCNVCGKGFKRNSALQRHLKYIHTDNRQFVCKHCDKTFKSPSCLRKHLVRHSGYKSFICLQCGKGFYEKAKLGQHMRVHTGEKPYSCDTCEFKCNLHGNLVKHKRKHQS